MNYQQARNTPHWNKFHEAMKLEDESHEHNEHWEVVLQSTIPKNQRVLPAVWAFRRKRRIATNEVCKWKARLNIHGGKQEYGINYWETYAPTLSWPTIWLFLNLMILNNWQSRQVDFVLAFPQADVECNLYMEIPVSFKLDQDPKLYVLKLKRNLYGQSKLEGCGMSSSTRGY